MGLIGKFNIELKAKDEDEDEVYFKKEGNYQFSLKLGMIINVKDY